MSDSEDGPDAADAAENTAGDDDGFDEEAERERLREKYERDKARREATQKMSELLLQGATMTNHHCDECGSPIFRYDGEEFCPSCGGTTGMDEDAAADAEGAAGDATGQAGADEGSATGEPDGVRQAEPRRDEARRTSADASRTAEASRTADASRTGDGERSSADDGRAERSPAADRPESLAPERSVRPDPSELQAGADAPTAGDRSGRSRGPSSGLQGSGRLQGASVDEAPSLAQARASLRRAIVSLSEQAAQSDDPERAKELLRGAREGAEALAVLQDD
ncbi:hypothetical protein BRC81_05075 [Halobacteriales archaeon QS_1_68_20]|nr:MAG: hypothetical protein BRC81_05075 [Halobacteriales archaeon QS_1_68_20]